MGTQQISLSGQADPRVQRSSFRRLFVWYSLGALGATVIVTGLIETIGFAWLVFRAHGRSPMFPDQISQVVGLALVTAVPVGVLLGTILVFAWLMGRKISRPVNELMSAVEKIRQQDLDFSIEYSANDELGALCGAFNELRRELREALEREWREQEEMRVQMAALSHDLRTPVAILQGHIEGLARAEAGETRAQRLERYLPVLEASSQRLMRLLDDVLLVASLEQTSFVAQPQVICLEEELARKAQVYQLQAAAHEIDFSYSNTPRPTQPAPVRLDIHRVEQILDNLFENALRYTSAQGQITLTSTYDAQTLALTLSDTGVGVAQHDLPHVFEKFYHGQRLPTAKAHTSAGLGLYICKRLVEALGGAITLRNRPTGGCEVTVDVPLLPGS